MQQSCLVPAPAAAPFPTGLEPFPLPDATPAELHFPPHYRAQLPLETVLLNTKAGLDQFITEKYHDQIAATLVQWTASLLRSPQESALEKSLASDFSGPSLTSFESKTVRPGPIVEVRRNKFSQAPLGRETFLQSWQSSLSTFSKL